VRAKNDVPAAENINFCTSVVGRSALLRTLHRISFSVQSAKHYTEAAEDEVKLLRAIRDTNPEAAGRRRAVLLIDDFIHYGPYGSHICMVMEVLGNNLLRMIKSHQYKGVPITLLRRILRQCLEALDYLHIQCKIIHTDIKPENILLCQSWEEIKVMGDAALAGRSRWPSSGSGGGSGPPDDHKPLTKNQKRNAKRRQKQKERKASASTASGDDGGGGAGGGGEGGADETADAPSSPVPHARAPSVDDDGSDGSPRRARSATTHPLASAANAVSKDVQQALYFSSSVKIADLGNACWVVR
jgi:serine/threonine protein kinase